MTKQTISHEFLIDQDLIRTAVPTHFRPLLWQNFAQVENSSAKQIFSQLLIVDSPCEKVIRRDITRTYPEHVLFKDQDGSGQESLFNVIKVRQEHNRFQLT